ncbi:unnamed protein product [Adineta steineri]|uniref:Uncharacterized protein n=2 Tax=Adineta steineri TaxID=433720 RepID=A0A818GYW9_9BILA|nr:unnamed protein product [Adineta steineri]
MSENNLKMSDESEDLWLKIVNEGVEDRVEVNQRMLIDKMLARYSSDFVVYRELIQNSDDAKATSFTLEITCDPSSSTQTYESINNNDNSRQSTNILNGIGQLIKNHWNNSIDNTENLSPSSSSPSINENNFHNCIITEIRTVNNGNIFNEDDWKRVITIAEGNTNVDSIGQFGVGFFSVFSYSEKPMIQSGKQCLAFAWQNGKSLTTFRKELSNEQQSNQTSIILKMKNKFILQTKSSIEYSSKKSKLNNNRTSKSKKNTITNEIVPIMDLIELKSYFTKVLSFTKYINELIIKINGFIIFKVNKTSKEIPSTKLSLASKRMNSNGEHNLLHFNSFLQTEQRFTIENGPSITLNHIDVQANVIIDKDFHKQIQKVLKKDLPSTIHIQFLFPSNNIFEEEQWKTLTDDNNLNNKILKNLIPLKIIDGKIHPFGQIFIGLATHQTTGIGMHVFTHLVPTIERENIDLQDPYISIWNEQLLISIGKIIRFIYDQTILDSVNHIEKQTIEIFNSILSPYAFQESSPNKDIGRILVDGFFSSDKDILVPVRRSPSDAHLSLIPSTEAYIANSKHIEKFLPIPLIPYEIGKNDFFKILKHRQCIEEIDNHIILTKIHESILLLDEFIELLRWLCTIDMNKKSYIKQILSKIHYRLNSKSKIIKLNDIEYFDTLNLPLLPLPSNVLPSNIVLHISRDDLQRRLSLTTISIKYLIEFYLNEKQNYLLIQEDTLIMILNFISSNLKQFNQNEITQIKTYLSNIKSIPTTKGIKTPNESYIQSNNLSSNLPIITLYIPQIENNKQQSTEYPVSLDFLKSIGCRTIHVPTLTNSINNNNNNQENTSQDNNNTQTLQTFIQDLLQQRKNMSENDLKALKHNHCITGTTLESNGEIKRKYMPNELHFPSVANRLQWNNLPIIDWFDIEPRSQEYLFLKELGVKEVPDLNKLISRIDQEHSNNKKTKVDYKLPQSLTFFAENFQEYYSKSWKNSNIKMPFLPSSLPDKNRSTEVILTTPEHVFKEEGPLCASLLPDVIQCFSQYFDIGLLGVKHRPPISFAFDILMEKRNDLLNIQTAPIYFSYLNKLDGLNRIFIQKLSTISFIPLTENNIYVKPSQVFIRSKGLTTNEKSSPNDDKNNFIEDIAIRGLIDYIDYGYEANSFLKSIGVVCYPSAENLANLLIERQSNYFALNKQNTDEILSAKLRIYTNCLKQLAVVSNVAREFNSDPLRSRLINKPWCLGYQIIEKENGNKERIFKIGKPNEIYLDDDHQCAIDLRPLCAPEEPELTKLYEQFGSKWISESVKRTLIHRGKTFTTERSKKLRDLIIHRLDMLFVNNRGETMENIDEKRIELLRKKFLVYESEAIQCQLTFQNKTITLNSTECSSCALEHDKSQVVLFIQKDISTLDYIDISSELTRFVYKKPLDTLVHSISDKLASPLETLKRRGIPVDRLLKIQEQQQIKLLLNTQQNKVEEKIEKQVSQQQQQQQQQSQPDIPQKQIAKPEKIAQPIEQHHNEQVRPEKEINRKQSQQYEQNDQSQRGGFFQNLKDYFIPLQFPSPSPTPTIPSSNSTENLSSNIETNRVSHFGEHKRDDDDDINQMIKTSRPYSEKEFNQNECSRNEINNSCEFVPSSNMIRHSDLFHGIPLYIDKNVQLTNLMIDQGNQLAYLLCLLAKQVFSIPIKTMHLFRDIDSARIAFNSGGSLFFNLRYFEQVYWDDLKSSIANNSSSSSNPVIRRIVNFYFMVTCHELSHNIDSNHDLNFINRLERVSVRFMDAKDAFISTFYFP